MVFTSRASPIYMCDIQRVGHHPSTCVVLFTSGSSPIYMCGIYQRGHHPSICVIFTEWVISHQHVRYYSLVGHRPSTCVVFTKGVSEVAIACLHVVNYHRSARRLSSVSTCVLLAYWVNLRRSLKWLSRMT